MLCAFTLQAKYTNGTITLNDGTKKTGLVEMILKDKTYDFDGFSSWMKVLGLDQKALKFKTNEDARAEDVSIDLIREAVLEENGRMVTYRTIFLKTLNAHGALKDKKKKIFLPLIREGKVNIYGFSYRYSSTDNSGMHSRIEVVDETLYFFQKPGDDFAFDYYDVGLTDLLYLRERLAKPLQYLFSDCPELVAEIQTHFIESKDLAKDDKKKLKEQSEAFYASIDRQYEALTPEMRADLMIHHKYNYPIFDGYIETYETKCP